MSDLLSHGTLVCVSGRLIMMRVWNEASNYSKDSEGLNLQVSSLLVAILLIEGNEGIVLFIHIQILNQPSFQKVSEAPLFRLDLQ